MSDGLRLNIRKNTKCIDETGETHVPSENRLTLYNFFGLVYIVIGIHIFHSILTLKVTCHLMFIEKSYRPFNNSVFRIINQF